MKNTKLIKEFEYSNGNLTITFRNNKRTVYKQVPKHIIDGLELSESMETFFSENINGNYEAKNIEDADQLLFS